MTSIVTAGITQLHPVLTQHTHNQLISSEQRICSCLEEEHRKNLSLKAAACYDITHRRKQQAAAVAIVLAKHAAELQLCPLRGTAIGHAHAHTHTRTGLRDLEAAVIIRYAMCERVLERGKPRPGVWTATCT